MRGHTAHAMARKLPHCNASYVRRNNGSKCASIKHLNVHTQRTESIPQFLCYVANCLHLTSLTLNMVRWTDFPSPLPHIVVPALLDLSIICKVPFHALNSISAPKLQCMWMTFDRGNKKI